MSSMQPSGYRFGATYVGSKMIGPHEAFPLLLADIDPSGNLNANIVHAPSDRTRLKMIAQIQGGKWQSTQLTADYKGDAFTTSLTLGNPDLIGGSGVGVLHYLRSVTPWLALGSELAYQVRKLSLLQVIIHFLFWIDFGDLKNVSYKSFFRSILSRHRRNCPEVTWLLCPSLAEPRLDLTLY